MALVAELPYISDSSHAFTAIAARPWSIYLDSCHPFTEEGRWDILTADPFLTLVTWDKITEQRSAKGLNISQADPFQLLRQTLGTIGTIEKTISGIPFAGGAIGWFGYDLVRRLEILPTYSANLEKIPDLAIGIFDWALVIDHKLRRSWLASYGRDPHTKEHWSQLVGMWSQHLNASNSLHTLKPFYESFPRSAWERTLKPFRTFGTPNSNLTFKQYTQAFHKIQNYIHNGDTYQVNFAQRFTIKAEGDAWEAYQGLRTINPAPYSAYLKTPYGQVLSSSPERFLTVNHSQVQTQPIKGTQPRGKNPEADANLAQKLQTSTKDRAENLMIVDLLRNDLGRVCIPGSIKVPELFELKQYATVQHLVSTITGTLAPGQDALSLLRACFPGGSITGAPKIRAMQIIEELEPQRRGIYCGTIGYIGFDGAMDTNIVIRTLVYNNGWMHLGAGGGLVYDSKLEHEYQETLDKAQALLNLLQNFSAIRISNGA